MIWWPQDWNGECGHGQLRRLTGVVSSSLLRHCLYHSLRRRGCVHDAVPWYASLHGSSANAVNDYKSPSVTVFPTTTLSLHVSRHSRSRMCPRAANISRALAGPMGTHARGAAKPRTVSEPNPTLTLSHKLHASGCTSHRRATNAKIAHARDDSR